jgi:hypothetical protein
MTINFVPDAELRKQAWDYFQLHANQRLMTFNFYLFIAALLTTGLLATFQRQYRAPFLGAGLGVLLVLLSFVFWKLDQRNKFLIKNAEAALRYFESQAAPQDSEADPHVSKVFLREESTTDSMQSENSWRFWKGHFSYSQCFNTIFFLLGSGGFVGAILAVWYQS